jgi:hypothetical protein
MNHYKKYLKVVIGAIGDTTTNDTQLRNLCTDLKIPLTGIYESDRPHSSFKNNSCFIANLDTIGMPGSHWICGINMGPKTILYDSFGRNVKLKSLKKRKVLYTESDREQDILESDCGARCVAALLVYYHHGLGAYMSL